MIKLSDKIKRGVLMTEKDIHQRVLQAIAIVSEKTWNGTDEEDTFAEWEIRNKTDGLYPKVDDAIVKDEKTTLYIQLMNSKTGEFDVYYNDQLINHVVVEPF